ncbi:GNAT family N-acetyltransferase [Marispirochaeta sp.]|jgi:leucyl-tRNA---protein transferase|uniref:GNAT family N-acetyltransferase n=1 Tax=Marispirochaeta sp. TaxID=2038653 RepID=UPI0029C83FDD|nr:GNAT family N-acetyltransferase [Marispirochaeta sp.]
MRASLLDTASYPCPYLSGKTARMEQFIAYTIGPQEHETLLGYGYRHFGTYYFRPACETCSSCVPLRVRVGDVYFHRSWRRLLKKSAGLDLRFNEPPSLQEAYDLYVLHKTRFGDGEQSDILVFRESFFSEHPVSRLLTLRDGKRLVAVAHFDQMPRSLSAVYTYYNDRDYGWVSPGKLCIIHLIQLAKLTNRMYLHLGYYVHENPFMHYKAGYTPFEYSPRGGEWSREKKPLAELSFVPGETLLR